MCLPGVVVILCGMGLIALIYVLFFSPLPTSLPCPLCSLPLPPLPSLSSHSPIFFLSIPSPLPPLSPLSLPSPSPLPPLSLPSPPLLLSSTTSALSFSTQLPNEVLTDPGSDVRLTCASDGSSDVEWLYNGEVIIGASENSHTVVNVTQSNSGYYQCRIGGAARGGIVSSSYVHTATVSVSGESCALLGSQHELVCTFEYPVMERDFRWFHNGQLMTSNQSRSGNVSTSRIVIDPVMEANRGEYTCQVRVVGSDSVLNDTFEVTIVGEYAACGGSQ